MPLDFGKLATSFLGGGGPESSTSQSSPFYNESGIYFQSPGAGQITGNTSDAVSSIPRSQAGGINPLPTSSFYSPESVSPPSDSSVILWILGGVLALALGAYFLIKK